MLEGNSEQYAPGTSWSNDITMEVIHDTEKDGKTEEKGKEVEMKTDINFKFILFTSFFEGL